MRYKNIVLVGFFGVICLTSLAEAQGERGGRRPRPIPIQEDPVEVDDGVVSSCPEYDGYFADASQCDKYYECTDGRMTEKLCPDGLVFDSKRSDIEKCDLQHLVDCSDRPLLQPPQPSPNCPRQNGYYAHNDTRICDKFFHCTDGRPHPIICPDGLVFSNKTATCSFRDTMKQTDCVFGASAVPKVPENLEELGEFLCPPVPETKLGIQVAHPLFPDPKDCQSYYICINGITPRKNACEFGQVFSEKTSVCTSPKDVPECKGWYADSLDYDENGDIATTTTTTTPKPKPKPKPRPGQVPVGPKRRGKPGQPPVIPD